MPITSISVWALIRAYPADKLARLQKALLDMQLSGTLSTAFESNSLVFNTPEQVQLMIDRIEVALQQIEGGGRDQTPGVIQHVDFYDRDPDAYLPLPPTIG